MITTNGIMQGNFADEIQYQITLNQLFNQNRNAVYTEEMCKKARFPQ